MDRHKRIAAHEPRRRVIARGLLAVLCASAAPPAGAAAPYGGFAKVPGNAISYTPQPLPAGAYPLPAGAHAPNRTCADILRASPGAPSGDYNITWRGRNLTAYCDMASDGGGYTALRIVDGNRTCRASDRDSCQALGMGVAVPRTRAHFETMVRRFGAAAFAAAAGVSKPTPF